MICSGRIISEESPSREGLPKEHPRTVDVGASIDCALVPHEDLGSVAVFPEAERGSVGEAELGSAGLLDEGRIEELSAVDDGFVVRDNVEGAQGREHVDDRAEAPPEAEPVKDVRERHAVDMLGGDRTRCRRALDGEHRHEVGVPHADQSSRDLARRDVRVRLEDDVRLVGCTG